MSEPRTSSVDALADIPREKWPRHIAIIMDGNGRWAQQQGLPRIEGHRRGVASVRRTVEECARLGLEHLTLYCLSSENWKRPRQELDFLMHLLQQYMIEERTTIMENNLQVAVIGRREGIPEDVLREMDQTVRISQGNTGLRLCLAINYGGRAEMVDAVRRLIRTAGEMRVSNFLLWQISYTEIWVTERCWPEFDEHQLHEAICSFASRKRRFGGLG